MAEKGNNLVIKTGNGKKWFENYKDGGDEKRDDDGESKTESKISPDEINRLRKSAEKMLADEVQLYKRVSLNGPNRADFAWMDKIMKSGSLPDRLASFTVRIQDSPVHNLIPLEHLIQLVKIQGKQQCLSAADTLKDLFLEDLLPSLPNARMLSTFESRGVKLQTAPKKELILYFYEDRLKSLYCQFVEKLKAMSSSPIDKIRGKSISLLYHLLLSHPEREAQLLQIIVNKLGDPVKKVGSRALFHLTKLLDEHPLMKMTVISEVERLIFRNNIGKSAQYYGICFLNTIKLYGEHPNIGMKLIKIYLAFFKACVKTGEIDCKIMSGLLIGLNKAFPHAKAGMGFDFLNENLNTLYKIVHLSHFNIGVQTLAVLFQITDFSNVKSADRYFRTLYSEILSPDLSTSSYAPQFLTLISKSLKKDPILNRLISFSKRLIQISQYMPANLACGILYILSEVSRHHKLDILNIKDDHSIDFEVKDEVKDEEAEELRKELKSNMKNLMKTTNLVMVENPIQIPVIPPTTSTEESRKVILLDDTVAEDQDEKKPFKDYDPLARNPSYSGAEFSSPFELTLMTRHFHPSVTIFAQSLMKKKNIKYDGNALKDFTLTRFLDRFVYKNPKLLKDENKSHKEKYQPHGLRNIAVNSKEYLKTSEEKIPGEELFFYKYFKDANANEKDVKPDDKPEGDIKSDDDDEDDNESIGDDEFDQVMGNYFPGFGKDLLLKDPDDPDGSDDEVDFAVEKTVTKKGKRKLEAENESESDEIDEDLGENDDENEDFDADDLIDLDDDAEDIDFDDDDDDIGGDFEDDDDDESFSFGGGDKPKAKLGKKLGAGKAEKAGDVFVSAEEFSEMLESNADNCFTGPDTLINQDNSNVKQMQWEMDRDRKMKGFGGHQRRGGARGGSGHGRGGGPGRGRGRGGRQFFNKNKGSKRQKLNSTSR